MLKLEKWRLMSLALRIQARRRRTMCRKWWFRIRKLRWLDWRRTATTMRPMWCFWSLATLQPWGLTWVKTCIWRLPVGSGGSCWSYSVVSQSASSFSRTFLNDVYRSGSLNRYPSFPNKLEIRRNSWPLDPITATMRLRIQWEAIQWIGDIRVTSYCNQTTIAWCFLLKCRH